MMSKYEQWSRLVDELGLSAYRLNQLKHAVFQRRTNEYARMDALPLNLRRALIDALGPNVCRATPITDTSGEQVNKLLFRLDDGRHVEAVALQYRRGWSSYCVSSQCGCAVGCAFCATGAMGFARNLSAEEITDQLLNFHLAGRGLDSVSFMGMGEPLLNPNLFEALDLLTDPTLFALGQRRITISTTGIIPGIRVLSRAYPQMNLAFSLHTPFDRQRSELVPINRKYPLREVMAALDVHIHTTNRKVFLAYTLLDSINDTDGHLRALARLVRGRPQAQLYHVDLIPYNPAGTKRVFAPSDMHRAHVFQAGLASAGVRASVRAQFGSEIQAACGQLCVQESPNHTVAGRDRGGRIMKPDARKKSALN